MENETIQRYLGKVTFFITVLLLSLVTLTTNALAIDQRIGNDYLEFVVSDNGRFTIGTTGGNEQSLIDNNKRLLYGHPSPGTSFTTLNIDGQQQYYQPSVPGYVSLQDLSHVSEKIIGDIKVKQIVSIQKNLNTNKDDTVEVKYIVTNNDSQEHDVGLRIMMDTMLGYNDAAPFKIPGTGDVVSETEYTGNNIPEYWQVFDDLVNPSVIAHGTFYSSSMIKPDKVQFTNWGRVYNTLWNYSILSGQPNGDSAVSIYWNPTTLGVGETKTFKTFYGISELTQDLRPPLTLSVTGASIVETTSEGYSPNPFTVTAYVSNIGSADALDANISIDLPDGLTLVDNESQEITLGTLGVGEERQVSWQVEIEPHQELTTHPYTINLSASNSDAKAVTRFITIPSNEFITDLQIEPATVSLARGETHQLTVTATTSAGTTKDVTSEETGTTYSSSDTRIAAVDSNGLVTIPEDSIGGTVYIRAYHNGKTKVSTVTVPDMAPVSLILNPETLTLNRGETYQLTALLTMSDGTQENVTSSLSYSSSNLQLATVDSNGMITILENATGGTVYIRGSYEGKTAYTTITIPSRPIVESLTFDPGSVTLRGGETQQLTVLANMSDGTQVDVTDQVTYSTSNANLATVNANGLIVIPENATGGTVYIRGTYEGKGSYSTVTVPQPPTVTSLTFEPGSVTLNRGETQQLRVIANMSDGTQQDVTDQVSYSTSNENLATVSVDGLISIPESTTGGTVYIRGSYGGKGAYTTVTVTPPPSVVRLTFVPATVTLQSGQTQQLRVLAEFSDGTQQDVTSSVSYSSSNSNLVTVDENGLITIQNTTSYGTVYIRGTYEGKGSYSTVTVPRPPSVVSLTFEPATAIIGRNQTLQLRVVANMSDGTQQDVTSSVSYSTSNANLATVDANGLISVPGTASGGLVYIRGSYEGKGSYTKVTVPQPPSVTSLSFIPAEVIIPRGQSQQLMVLANMSDGTQVDVTDQVTYSTSNANLATVDENGLITIPESSTGGVVYIRGNYGGKGSYSTVTVPQPPTVTSLTFDPGNVTLNRGETQQLRIIANMSDGTQVDVTDQVAYSTSNANLATVDENGLITVSNIANSGSVYIRGNYGGKGSYTVVTIPTQPTITSLTFEPGNITLASNDTLQVRVFAEMSNGTRIEVTDSVTFSSSNTNLATVDADGLVSVQSNVTSGSVYIRGNYGGKGGYMTITII